MPNFISPIVEEILDFPENHVSIPELVRTFQHYPGIVPYIGSAFTTQLGMRIRVIAKRGQHLEPVYGGVPPGCRNRRQSHDAGHRLERNVQSPQPCGNGKFSDFANSKGTATRITHGPPLASSVRQPSHHLMPPLF